MGFRIGRTDEVIRSAATLGLASLVFAAATMAGTLAVLSIVFELRGRGGGGRPLVTRPAAGTMRGCPLGEPLLLLGMPCRRVPRSGSFCLSFPGPTASSSSPASCTRCSSSSARTGRERAFRPVRFLTHPDLLLIPAGHDGRLARRWPGRGTRCCTCGPARQCPSPPASGGTRSQGCILTRLDSPGLGAVSFLSNMLRESMALILIPLLARTRFPLLAIGAGGATSMDVTLPLIEKNCGPAAVPLSIASGGVLERERSLPGAAAVQGGTVAVLLDGVCAQSMEDTRA